ncbi:MAG: hypothetical protein JHD02_08075 [Thermoleophilaceae bacterium]|nr:hypothetical protein [Thermoleophilaceae bacterium]
MTLPHRSIRAALIALAAAISVAAAGAVWSAPADAAVCGKPVPYPGNSADAESFANWMANAAMAKGLPGELPVMAGLVESGLKNLNYGDADSVGFFQMRASIWNKGKYAGYLKKPDLQMQWFTDTAASVRSYYKSSGKGDPAASSKTYGVWIADIERPAAQYRGRYQPRLAQAQKLVAATCVDLQGVNVLAPTSRLKIKRRQHPGRTGAIAVQVSCPQSPCLSTVRANFRVPGRRGVVKLSSDTAMIAAGSRLTLRVLVPHKVRKRIRQLGGSTTKARLRVSVAGTNGASTVRIRNIALAK